MYFQIEKGDITLLNIKVVRYLYFFLGIWDSYLKCEIFESFIHVLSQFIIIQLKSQGF